LAGIYLYPFAFTLSPLLKYILVLLYPVEYRPCKGTRWQHFKVIFAGEIYTGLHQLFANAQTLQLRVYLGMVNIHYTVFDQKIHFAYTIAVNVKGANVTAALFQFNFHCPLSEL
jgi:hypothetical protein